LSVPTSTAEEIVYQVMDESIDITQEISKLDKDVIDLYSYVLLMMSTGQEQRRCRKPR
jgi:hypothetical protein